jgi:hypothetical protein
VLALYFIFMQYIAGKFRKCEKLPEQGMYLSRSRTGNIFPYRTVVVLRHHVYVPEFHDPSCYSALSRVIMPPPYCRVTPLPRIHDISPLYCNIFLLLRWYAQSESIIFKTHSKTIVLQDYRFYLLVFFLSLLLFTVPRPKTIVLKDSRIFLLVYYSF